MPSVSLPKGGGAIRGIGEEKLSVNLVTGTGSVVIPIAISPNGQRRVALIEHRTKVIGADPAPQRLVRFQHGDHLGSAVLELDAAAQVISYEEYHPYGSAELHSSGNQGHRCQ